MKHQRFLALGPLLITGALITDHLQAQSIRIDFDKKVILTDSLNLPLQTPVNTVLSMMSELLQRANDVLLSNYDIQVNGMSVDAASDVALCQLDIQDVEKIEISESPITSYKKNGQGGTINLTLRQRDTDNDGHWGSTGIDISYPTAFDPQVHVGYRNGKFRLSALALSDIYRNVNTTHDLTFTDDQLEANVSSDFSEHYRSQLTSLMMEYHPTSKDQLKMSLSESYTYGKEVTTPNYQAEAAQLYRYKHTNLQAKLTYIHHFVHSRFNMEAQYDYTPKNEYHHTPEVIDLDTHSSGHSLSGKMEYLSQLMDPSSPQELNIAVGCNFNNTHSTSDLFYNNMLSYTFETNHLEPENHTYFVQPYVYMVASMGKFRAKIVGEFQHFRYDLSKMDDEFEANNNDFEGQAILEWHFMPNKTLRLIGARALQRPGEDQLFPYRFYDPNAMNYVQGNKNLTPVMTHELRLDYVSDERWDEHRLHCDMNVSYKMVRDMIEKMEEKTGGEAEPYFTFMNNGMNDILSGNLMAIYSYGSFAVALTGNIFHNKQHLLKGEDHYTYYNLSLNPHFNLKDGWQGSFAITYNSPVETSYSTLSDLTQVSTSIGKRWKNLYLYVVTDLPLQKEAENTSWSNNSRKVHLYEMLPNHAGFGVKYVF